MGRIQQWLNRCFALINNKTKHSNGQQAETFAAQYLQRQGLKLLDQNYNTKLGEIDLIMRDGQCLVFIEVKFRARSDWAHAAETVTLSKQQKIIRTAQLYLQNKQLSDRVYCRFDVVAIDNEINEENLNWLKNAFC
ncbi:YraN family protein [Marinicella sp. S1101]|uniref:YraN family protein n=1 Tax=Marinicella marina TaxID=2996016 RepID=UPI002260F2EA|nr:YraN family protein [Marinicella marina]MCX7552653.1 YraN family protein [Marinicella marina]MDJ1139529.1 YraN family protein [Marinicella marina]